MTNTRHLMNRFFYDTFSSLDESVCAQLKVENLHERARNYIVEVVGTTEALLGKGSIHSVVLFGSLAYDTISKISDVDLLIVVQDDIKYREIRKIEGILKSIEIKYDYAWYPQNFISKILRVVEKTTGMFCSHFVCRYEAWRKEKFAKIFSTFKPFTYLLAPELIVLDSMKSGATLLYGDLDLSITRKKYPLSNIRKSMLMNFALYCGGLAMIPFADKHISYILESFKWSLRTVYFVLFQKTQKLDQILIVAERMGLSKKIIAEFRQLRKHPQLKLKFVIKLPFHLFKIHVLLYKYLKF